VSRLTDTLEDLERELGSYRTDHASDLLNRRFILRKALEKWGAEQYEQGHTDGMRDVHDTQREARRRADEAAGQETQQEGNDNA
jgi:hypothetical protein